jgi:hypothetical protein
VTDIESDTNFRSGGAPIHRAFVREVCALDQAISAEPDPLKRDLIIRQRLAFVMTDCVQNPAKYSNADVLDLIRDAAHAYQMEFRVQRDPAQAHILHIFVKSVYEPAWDLRPMQPDCAQWLGYVERSHGAEHVQGSR